jgi:hypothetical protein
MVKRSNVSLFVTLSEKRCFFLSHYPGKEKKRDSPLPGQKTPRTFPGQKVLRRGRCEESW